MPEDNPQIDMNRLTDLMEEYRATHDRQKRRQIENKVLEQTVWKVRPTEYHFSEKDLRKLRERIDDDDEEGKRILRKPYVSLL